MNTFIARAATLLQQFYNSLKPGLDRFIVHQLLSTLVLVVWIYLYLNYHIAGEIEFTKRDPMAAFTYGAVILVVFLSIILDRDQVTIYKKLNEVGVIQVKPENWIMVDRSLRRWNLRIVGTFIAVLFVVVCLGYDDQYDIFSEPHKLLTDSDRYIYAIIGVLSVGYYIGRTLANAFSPYIIERYSDRFSLVIGHPDGAGGLDTIGRYFLYRGCVPIVFIGTSLFWLWIVPHGIGSKYGYEDWIGHFWRLFFFSTIVLVFNIGMPLIYFRGRIKMWKMSHGLETTFQDWPLSYATLRVFSLSVALPVTLTIISILVNFLIASDA